MCPIRVNDASTHANNGAYSNTPNAIVISGIATRNRKYTTSKPIDLIKSSLELYATATLVCMLIV